MPNAELDREIARRARGRRHAQAVGIIVPAADAEGAQTMRYYRYPKTGEIVRFELETMEWRDMRCDQSTGYEVRFVPTTMAAHDAAELVPVSESEMMKDHAEMRKANSAARGEAFLGRIRSTGMGF